MLRHWIRLSALASVIFGPAWSYGAITLTTSATYASTNNNNNRVISVAAASAANGVTIYQYASPTGAINQTDPAAIAYNNFRTDVSNAYTANTGGVITFDNTSGSDSTFNATYGASAANTLTLGFTNLTTPGNTTGAIGGFGSAAVISGGNAFSTNPNGSSDSYRLSLTAPSGQAVTQVGVTVLSRASNGEADQNPNVTLIVVLSDNTTLSLSSNVRRNTGTADNAIDNTFFLFTAPTGLGITSLSYAASSGRQLPLDDLGFITTTVPEPASLSACGLFLFASLKRRRTVK